MNDFKVDVVESPAKRLVGMKVRTDMRKAQTDCPALWRTFGPRIAELSPAGCGSKESFGLSVMLNAEEFDYWAAVEEEPGAAVPSGLDRVDLPAGLYATCTVSNLEKLSEAYMFLYTQWPQSQTAYTVNEQTPCFELYSRNWQLSDPLTVFMPVKKI